MLTYIDIPTTLTVPVSCAGAEDEIDLAVVIAVTVDQEAEQAWVETVHRDDGASVSPLDSVFLEAEAWVDRRVEFILRGDI
jgi:hypothetical protein